MSFRAQLEVESQLISAAVEEHEHEKERAAGLAGTDEIDSSSTDWDGGGRIVAAASAMLAKAPANYKTGSPRTGVGLSDYTGTEARDRELDERKQALLTRKLELGRLQKLCDVRLRSVAIQQHDAGSPQSSPRSARSWGSNPASGSDASTDGRDESEFELEAADKQIEAQFTALITLDARWDEWRTWRRAKLHSELGKRAGMPRHIMSPFFKIQIAICLTELAANVVITPSAGPGSKPRALRLMLQREGADLDECTILLPREHARSLALQAELAAKEAEKISKKTRRATEARASLLARRKQARAQVEEHAASTRGAGGNAGERSRKGVVPSPIAGSLTKRVSAIPHPAPESKPESEPAATLVRSASPADIEKLMRHGRHADAMKAMQSLIQGRGSLNFARAVARAAAGVGERRPEGGDVCACDEETEGKKAPSWLKPAPKDWREVRQEEKTRQRLHQSTRGGIRWKKLVDTEGGDIPYAATTNVQYSGVKHADAATNVAEGQEGQGAAGSSLGMTQDLAEAAGGLPPDVLEHLSAVW